MKNKKKRITRNAMTAALDVTDSAYTKAMMNTPEEIMERFMAYGQVTVFIPDPPAPWNRYDHQ